jgi:hypothetical protein
MVVWRKNEPSALQEGFLRLVKRKRPQLS